MTTTEITTKNTNHYFFKALAVLMALSIAAGSLVEGARPAQASAFPGTNGKIVFSSDRDGNFEIYSMKPDGTKKKNLTNNAALDAEPAVSPDGTNIAFRSNRSGNGDIYIMSADGTTQVNLTKSDVPESEPTFSADGTKIAFVREVVKGDKDTAVMDTDGSGLTPIAFGSDDEDEPSFSPDGKKIAFRSNEEGNDKIYTMNSDGSNQVKLTDSLPDGFAPTWSPNGKQIAFSSHTQGFGTDTEIVKVNADGTGLKQLTDNQVIGDFRPSFSPDGKKIAFTSFRNGEFNVFSMNAKDGSRQKQLTKDPSFDSSLDWGVKTG